MSTDLQVWERLQGYNNHFIELLSDLRTNLISLLKRIIFRLTSYITTIKPSSDGIVP